MVLRSGIIIPFQFRDNKKLLTIGVPEENRDLSIWDLKNVVRSAFGIYNFEFRNKKIGFNIPDDLLLNYLAQRHDLTNFVIEVVQAFEDHATENGNDEGEKHKLSYEPTCSQMLPAALPQKSSESSSDEATAQNLTLPSQKPSSDLYTESHTLNNSSSGRDTPQKIRITQVYSKHTMPETLTQSIDPMDIIPKSEQDESESMMRHPRYDGGDRILQQQQQQQQFLQICGRNMHSPGIQQFAQGNISNRFRPYDTTNCLSCRCLPLAQKSSDDSNATPAKTHSNQRHFRHSSSSNNDSPTAEPAYKIQRYAQNSNELPPFTSPANTNESETDIKPVHLPVNKVDYDCITNNEDEATAATTTVPASTAYCSDAPSPELHFERMQMHHEYFLQQQQQHQHLQQQQQSQQHLQQQQQQQQQHLQQQQQQQHLEVLIHERTGSIGGNSTLRQRKERMSRRQKEVYVTYLEQTPAMSEYKRNDPVLDIHWQKLTEILNSVPQGAVKTLNEWKQAFDNWRFRIFLYARYNSKITGDAVLNSKNFKPLTMTDKRAYALWIRNADTAPPDLSKMRNIFANMDETQPE